SHATSEDVVSLNELTLGDLESGFSTADSARAGVSAFHLGNGASTGIVSKNTDVHAGNGTIAEQQPTWSPTSEPAFPQGASVPNRLASKSYDTSSARAVVRIPKQSPASDAATSLISEEEMIHAGGSFLTKSSYADHDEHRRASALTSAHQRQTRSPLASNRVSPEILRAVAAAWLIEYFFVYSNGPEFAVLQFLEFHNYNFANTSDAIVEAVISRNAYLYRVLLRGCVLVVDDDVGGGFSNEVVGGATTGPSVPSTRTTLQKYATLPLHPKERLARALLRQSEPDLRAFCRRVRFKEPRCLVDLVRADREGSQISLLEELASARAERELQVTTTSKIVSVTTSANADRKKRTSRTLSPGDEIRAQQLRAADMYRTCAVPSSNENVSSMNENINTSTSTPDADGRTST
ncbi:unnamed protein product, partial [Amoebophrya sp. A25]